MMVLEVMEELFRWCADDAPHDYSNSCDTLKCGRADTVVRKAAVTMFATPEVIRAAAQWGAQLLIVHEPTFYDHFDKRLENDPVTAAKERLLQETGLAVWRYHDHPHARYKDMIGEGEVKYLGLRGKWNKGNEVAVNRFLLEEPMTPCELAQRFRDKLHADHVRICGAADQPCTRLSLCFGTPNGVFEELSSDEIDVVLTGEACEWKLGEYAHDAAQLGFRKALLILGHIPSERDGMRLLSDLMQERFKDLETRYFECGEVYIHP